MNTKCKSVNVEMLVSMSCLQLNFSQGSIPNLMDRM